MNSEFLFTFALAKNSNLMVKKSSQQSSPLGIAFPLPVATAQGKKLKKKCCKKYKKGKRCGRCPKA